jgi:putative transcriptional regulator
MTIKQKQRRLTRKQATNAIGDHLREVRIAEGLSQEALAVKAGLDRKTVNRIENGLFSPSIDTLVRLCQILGKDAGGFLNESFSKAAR